MHHLPFGARLNKGILMVTQLNRGFRGLYLFCSPCMVEAMGVEPMSKNQSVSASPSADVYLHSLTRTSDVRLPRSVAPKP